MVVKEIVFDMVRFYPQLSKIFKYSEQKNREAFSIAGSLDRRDSMYSESSFQCFLTMRSHMIGREGLRKACLLTFHMDTDRG